MEEDEEPVQFRAGATYEGLQERGAWGIPRPSEVIVASAASSLLPSPRRGFTPTASYTAQQACETAWPLLPSAPPHRALSPPPALPTHAGPARVSLILTRWWSR